MNRLVTVERAAKIIAARVRSLPAEVVPLDRAEGRILREDVRADRDYPPYDRVTMDGIAIRFPGARRLKVEQTVQAGQGRTSLRNPRAGCIEIMTGAVLPAGCDTIIPYEHIELSRGFAVVRKPVVRGQFVHRKGSDRKKGAVLLQAGVKLRSPQVAIIASTGRAAVRVSKMPSAIVVSTGDEIINVGRRAAAHQIRPSNARGIAAALRGIGCHAETPIVGDDRRRIFQTLEKALRTRDVLIVSGGVSMGKADFVPGVLKELGVKALFHGVSQRPGKPFWFGLSRDKKPVFALPGNPVSSLACFRRYILPLWSADAAEYASLAVKVLFDKPLTFFLPVRVESGRDGKLRATPLRYGGSGDLNSVGESDGFVELEKNRNVFPAGYVARFWRWHV